LALNYKHIPYRTQWVEFPDIGTVGKAIGAKQTTPNPDGSGAMIWTLPMLVDPNHQEEDGRPTVVSDSLCIVEYLERTYPELPLFPEGTRALHAAWMQFINVNLLNRSLRDLVIPECPNILSSRGRQYFVQTREVWLGTSLGEVCPDRETAWKVVREGLDKIAGVLDANGTVGTRNLTIVPGKVCYADFVLLSSLLWVTVTVGKEEIEALKTWNEGR
jgi:glutathione S-transferase